MCIENWKTLFVQCTTKKFEYSILKLLCFDYYHHIFIIIMIFIMLSIAQTGLLIIISYHHQSSPCCTALRHVTERVVAVVPRVTPNNRLRLHELATRCAAQANIDLMVPCSVPIPGCFAIKPG